MMLHTGIKLLVLFRLALLLNLWLVLPTPTHSLPQFFRRRAAQHEGGSDWTREAQRNLSRWESRLLLNTLGKLRSSHVLGEVPFDLYDPVVTCPPPSKLMRLDPTGPTEHPTTWVDGAKWMCVPFPRTARPGCVVLSFGSNDQFEFEEAALEMTPCTIHTFDCTTGMLGNATKFESINPDRHAFYPYCVGGREMATKNPSQVLTWEGILRVLQPLGTAAGPQQQQQRLQGGAGQRADGAGGRWLQEAHGSDEDAAAAAALRRRQQLQDAGEVTSAAVVAGDAGVGFEAAGAESRGDVGVGGGGGGRRLHQRGYNLGLGGGGGGGGGRGGRMRHPGPEVYILKIDVEGFEWQLLSEWRPNTPGLPGFLAIEIHNWVEEYVMAPPAPPPRPRYSALAWWLYGQRRTQAAARAAAAAVVARRQRVYGGELSLLFLHLARLGYAIVSRETNPNGDHEAKLCCAEFLLLRVRGPEEGRPGRWDWTNWLSGLSEGLGRFSGLVRGTARRLLGGAPGVRWFGDGPWVMDGAAEGDGEGRRRGFEC